MKDYKMQEAMKLALHLATMHHTDEGYDELRSKVRVAAKEALAKQEQGEPVGEPYGYLKLNTGKFVNEVEGLNPMTDKRYLPLYTTLQQRKPLTDEQIDFLNFLYGAGEWDGVWFEQKHPTEKGVFWWRKHMKRLFDYNVKE